MSKNKTTKSISLESTKNKTNKVLTSPQKKNLEKKLKRREFIGKLEKLGATRTSGYVGGKKNKSKKRKNKTRKKYKQKGGMPLVFHNLFDGIGFIGSSLVNTLNGVPHSANPLPFLGQFAV